MARAFQAIKVVARIRLGGTGAAALRTGLSSFASTVESALRVTLAGDFNAIEVVFKPKVSVLGGGVYQLYPDVVLSGETTLPRSEWGERWNAARDALGEALTAHVQALGAQLLALHTKEYRSV